MGNCQTVDAAALVIQHPNGKQERMYWSVKASEVMKNNPGHYVSLIIPLPISDSEQENSNGNKAVRFSRVKLLRSSDTLVLGHAYRLVTTQEVMKVLQAKKQAKMKENQSKSVGDLQVNQSTSIAVNSAKENNVAASRSDRHLHISRSIKFGSGRSNSWHPSLHRISESTS